MYVLLPFITQCPTDIFQCLLAVAYEIYEAAAHVTQANNVRLPLCSQIPAAALGADSFFPLFLYAINITQRTPLLNNRIIDVRRFMC